MIGVILIAHAHIASETKIAVEHILGNQVLFETIDIPNSDITQQEKDSFTALLKSTNMGKGVLVMADLYGGTPCNIAMAELTDMHIEVISGFNMPAVIKAITLRSEGASLDALTRECIIAGQQYICKGSDLCLLQNRSNT